MIVATTAKDVDVTIVAIGVPPRPNDRRNNIGCNIM
jgi:hypothetical protein